MARKRLFVPLKSKAYDWYLSGYKKWELRNLGRQYTRKHVYAGRDVELRKGYNGESLWGKIGRVYAFSSLEEILRNINYKEIIPDASNKNEAKEILEEIIRQKTGYIIFEIILEKKSVK